MKPATLLETWKTLLTVLLEHDKFREEHFQQCLVSFGDSFLTLTIQGYTPHDEHSHVVQIRRVLAG